MVAASATSAPSKARPSESRSSETMNRDALIATRAVNRMSVMKVKDSA